MGMSLSLALGFFGPAQPTVWQGMHGTSATLHFFEMGALLQPLHQNDAHGLFLYFKV
jgi:hypothetical protein